MSTDGEKVFLRRTGKGITSKNVQRALRRRTGKGIRLMDGERALC